MILKERTGIHSLLPRAKLAAGRGRATKPRRLLGKREAPFKAATPRAPRRVPKATKLVEADSCEAGVSMLQLYLREVGQVRL
jgi:hypothetical protein